MKVCNLWLRLSLTHRLSAAGRICHGEYHFILTQVLFSFLKHLLLAVSETGSWARRPFSLTHRSHAYKSSNRNFSKKKIPDCILLHLGHPMLNSKTSFTFARHLKKRARVVQRALSMTSFAFISSG